MPSKGRDADADASTTDAPREKHRRSKSDRKSDKDKDREHRHHRSSRSSHSKLGGDERDDRSHVSKKRHRKREKDGEGQQVRDDELKGPSVTATEVTAGNVNTSADKQRISLPYPSFSKAHSKEAVLSRDDLSKRPSNPPTPEPTDCSRDEQPSKSAELPQKSSTSKKSSRPPTPPETDVSADRKRAERQAKGEDEPGPSKTTTDAAPSRPTSRDGEASKVGRRSVSSSQATYVKSAKHASPEKVRPSASIKSSASRLFFRRPTSARSSRRDDAADDRPRASSARHASPKTPTPSTTFSPSQPRGDETTMHTTSSSADDSGFHSKTATPAPPPPPDISVQDMPRVDYLLLNGGLPSPVPKRFLSAMTAAPNGSRPSNGNPSGAETLFAPFFNVLDQYSTVLSKHGSIAVATGHRSVARRLLDRLENVFSRDLPAHGCACVMCHSSPDLHQGLTWGDVLEWVSGRIELPAWPPFDLAEMGTKAAEISAEEPPRPASPVKLDPDIAEEFREHYLRQSKKVRSAVDKWLNQTGETPQDVDDETLAFAILTNLEPAERPYFNSLLSGSRDLKSAARPATPSPARSDFVVKCGLALQRLYRLPTVPRDAESATYLVKNPATHDLLVTISNINNSEWEILTSGRFDGFLWSGADADDCSPGIDSRGGTPFSGLGSYRSVSSPAPCRGPSASSTTGGRQTPFSPYSRGTTPASFVSLASTGVLGGRHPVSNDEEMEMAAAAEIEREIFAGMELLEDAFEKLHHKAEMVRTALRQRGAGLMQNFQSRRRIDVLPVPGQDAAGGASERPPWAASEGEGEGGSDDDWALDDVDIMPDDSASNISSSRHRRPKRRTERRTPAPIEEDEEEEP